MSRSEPAEPAEPADVRAWSPDAIPDQSGRTALVTGASPGGIGLHAARGLAARGARVILGGRSPEKLAAARRELLTAVPGADVDELVVDLADLGSVRAAADRVEEPLHLLLNNAGVMAPPYRRTPDGFELQLATNHLGPFLLTGLLLPRLAEAGGVAGGEGADARVVTVSSVAHRIARSAPLEDPRVPEGRYRRWPAYGRSKLANLLFTLELDRRLRAAGLPARALAAHPGFAATHLVANGQVGRSTGLAAGILGGLTRLVAQSAEQGAWPLLRAATDDLPGATYVGPDGPRESRGRPVVVGTSDLARDPEVARALWEVSERAVDLAYP